MEKGRRRASIQKRVVVSILLVGVVPGILVVVLTYLSGINALKKTIGSNFQEIATEAADKIQIIMDREIRDSQRLALSPYIRNAVSVENRRKGGGLAGTSRGRRLDKDLSIYLREYLKEGGRESGSIIVTDRVGHVIASSADASYGEQGGEGWWTEAFNRGRGKVFVSSISYQEDLRAYSIAIAVPIFGPGGAMGVLREIYNVEDIFRAITGIKAGKTGHANLVNNEGTLLVCPIFPPKSHRVNENLMRQISARAPGWGVAGDDAHGGRNSIIGFAPVIPPHQMEPASFGGKSWYIFVRQLPEETYAPMYALLWEASLLGALFIVVLTILGVYAAKKIVRPISILAEGARLIGSGRLGHRLEIRTGDELEELSGTFNQMAGNLEKSYGEIERHLHLIEESEERYKALFDHAEDSMLMLDPLARIVAANKREEEVLGYPKEAVVGRVFGDFLSEKDRPVFTAAFHKAIGAEKPPTAEVEVMSRESGVLTMEMDLTGIRKGGETAFVQAHLRNITRRKVLEREVGQERNKLEAIIESMGDGLDIVDRDFAIQFMNGRFLKQFGSDSIGKRCYEVYAGRNGPCDECPVVRGLDRAGVLELTTIQGQTLLITHSPFRNMDSTVSILEIFTDITEMKKLEKAIRESEERYKNLFDYATDSMLMVDRDGDVIAVNKREEEVIGHPRDSVAGRPFSIMLSGKGEPVFNDLFERVLAGGKAPTAEIEVLSPSKSVITMEMDLIGLRKDEAVVYALVHLRDIRKRKGLEEQLLRAERVAALSHLSSTLAHDLRNPIIGIRKRLESLQGTVEASRPEGFKRVIKDVISGSDLLLGMVNDVLDVYRKSYDDIPLIISDFPLIVAVEDAIKLLQTEAEERRVSIDIECEERGICVQGDKRRLQRVFINLLDNAIKYSPAFGRVGISLGQEAGEPHGWAVFDIRDEGPGLPPGEVPKIFEPLYTKGGRKDGVTGTGLGLYFCKVVVEAHGGSIRAGNSPGGGAAFRVRIPVKRVHGD